MTQPIAFWHQHYVDKPELLPDAKIYIREKFISPTEVIFAECDKHGHDINAGPHFVRVTPDGIGRIDGYIGNIRKEDDVNRVHITNPPNTDATLTDELDEAYEKISELNAINDDYSDRITDLEEDNEGLRADKINLKMRLESTEGIVGTKNEIIKDLIEQLEEAKRNTIDFTPPPIDTSDL